MNHVNETKLGLPQLKIYYQIILSKNVARYRNRSFCIGIRDSYGITIFYNVDTGINRFKDFFSGIPGCF